MKKTSGLDALHTSATGLERSEMSCTWRIALPLPRWLIPWSLSLSLSPRSPFRRLSRDSVSRAVADGLTVKVDGPDPLSGTNGSTSRRQETETRNGSDRTAGSVTFGSVGTSNWYGSFPITFMLFLEIMKIISYVELSRWNNFITCNWNLAFITYFYNKIYII